MTKRTIPAIVGKRIILRLLERDDLLLTLSWRNQDDIRRWFLNTAIIPKDSHYAWFDRYQEFDTDFVFLILAKDLNHVPVGQVSLYDIDWNAGTAEFGRLLIGEPLASGKGFAKDATKLLLEYSFIVLGLQKIFLEVKEENVPAKAIYQAVGFTEISRKNNLVTMALQKNNFLFTSTTVN